MQKSAREYSKSTTRPFEEVVSAIQDEAMKRNFRTLHVHDVRQTLSEKGFEIPPYSIIEVCNAGFAHRVLTTDMSIGTMLPCRIVVYDRGADRAITMMNPTLMSSLFEEADLGDVPRTVELALTEVIDAVAKEVVSHS